MRHLPLLQFAPSPVLALALALVMGVAPGTAPAAPATCNPLALFGPPTIYVTGPSPAYIVSRDFNGDGILDLAVTNTDFQNGGLNNSVAILIGLGGTSYATPVLYPVGLNPHMVAAGDFNEDGIADLVVANKWSSTISVLLGAGSGGVGDGTFAPAVNYPTGGYPFQIVVEDFDHDGIDDLAVSLNSVAAIALLRGGGSGGVGNGTFGPPISFPINNLSTGLERGDFNLDGITDLIATENAAGTIALFLGTGIPTLGSGSFSPATHIPAGPLPFELGVGDFNEDGKPDLAVAEQTTGGGTAVMLGNGNGTFQVPTYLPTGNTVVVSLDDLNQDGITDLVIGTLTGFDNGDVRVYLGGGSGGVGNGTFGNMSSYGPIGDTYQILPGDFNGDGRRDLVVSYYLRTSIALLSGTCSTEPPPPPTAVLVSLVDVAVGFERVRITWSAGGDEGLPATVYRRSRDTEWGALRGILSDGTGMFRFEDPGVAPARSYGYRLGLMDADQEVFAGEVWIDTPARRLALRQPMPNPSDGQRIAVEFILADASPARLEVLDIAGRIVLVREVGALGPGGHRLDLAGDGPLRAGLYFIRLTQGGKMAMTRAAVVR